MPKYEKAFCRRLMKKDPDNYPDGMVTAADANKIYLKDINKADGDRRICENTIFYCAKECPVELSCINLFVDFDNHPDKIRPYYANRKHNQDHSPDCPRKLQFIAEHKKDSTRNQIYYFENDKIIFDFSKVTGLIANLNPTQKIATSSNNNPDIPTRIVDNYNRNNENTNHTYQKRAHHTNQLREIVELWDNYKEYNLNQKVYDADGNQIDFNLFFKKVQEAQLDKAVHIYYGQAYCRYFNNDSSQSLILNYSGPAAWLNGVNAKPQVIINPTTFENARCKTLFDNLKRYADRWEKDHTSSQSYFELYYLGNFEIKILKSKKKIISFNYSESQFPKCLLIQPNPKN